MLKGYYDQLSEIYKNAVAGTFEKISAAANSGETVTENKKAPDGEKVQNSRKVAESDKEYNKPITLADIQKLREITKAHNGERVSVNDFTSDDIQAAQKWAYQYYKMMGTKSPFFRAWFGDWRAYEDNTDTDAIVIKYGYGEHLPINTNARTIKNDDTGFEINIDNDIVGDSIHYASKFGDKKQVNQVLGRIDEIVKYAILLDSQISDNSKNNKKGSTSFMHYFYAPITINKAPFLVKLTVEEYGIGSTKRGYNVQRIKMSTLQTAQFSKMMRKSGQTGSSAMDGLSISNLYSLVKTYDKGFHQGKPVKEALLNEDGTPKVFYHQTENDFTIFDIGRNGAGTRDNETPFGIFLKSSDKDIGLRGKKQMPLYVSAKSPLTVKNRYELVQKLKEMSSVYDELYQKSKDIDKEYKAKEEKAAQDFKDYVIKNSQSENRKSRQEMYADPEFQRVMDAEEKVVEEWTEKASDNDLEMKKEIEKVLRSGGYDSVILKEDAGSWGRSTDAVIVLDNTQVKSATNNIGTFDGSNSDIRYSRKKSTTGESYVQIDENAIDLNNGKSIAQNIAEILHDKFNNIVIANGQYIRVNADTNREFTGSNWALTLKRKNLSWYNDKIKSLANADEILSVAKNWVNENIKHERKDNITSFGRGNILYKVGENGYSADVLVGVKEDGSAVLYDIINISNKKIEEAVDTVENKIFSSGDNNSSTGNDNITKLTESQEKEQKSRKVAERDREYNAAVKSGDMKTAAQLVEETARDTTD